MSRIDHGRSLLGRWESAKPSNFYDDDVYLRGALARHLGGDGLAKVEPDLRQAGADAAGPINEAAFELDRPEHLPRLAPWSRIGERLEDVVFHPAHDEVGRRVWRSGVLAALAEPGGMTTHAALVSLFAMNGEVPHLCSVACTAGLVKTIQRAGSDWMRREWLPRLTERDYDRRWHAAQFLTEVQGGSDVGANACVVRPDDPARGRWRLSGEKWFCSNVGADLYAVSARPESAPEGTAGLGLFVVPRRLDDGRVNGLRIRRLKNKLGTRTLPTAEVDFDGALAWQLGRLEDGFKLMIGLVINTSRVEVAADCAGMMRRAWVEAYHYARVREAFGHRLIDFPAVRAQLAEMRALGTGSMAALLWITALEDRLARAGARPEDDAVYRTAVNLTKYLASTDAGLVVHHGIEILGGNGTIEDFSPLPRLYREVPVQESWEGPHNTLVAQVLRDALRAKLHDALLAVVEELLLGVGAPALGPVREQALATLEDTRAALGRLLRGNAEAAALHARTLVGRLARLFQVAVLLDDARRPELATVPWLADAASLLLARARAGYDATADPDYAALTERLVSTAAGSAPSAT
ncbi:MAG TPA: acyl-CoA dehydrogenase family protein [Methylomirabilota bacterium]|nr:acyl-CoA dehydrogenase family protein [Methylomirabilota bacterium]